MQACRVRNILFATDFSAASEAAGHKAADLARQFGARLHVLHAVPRYFDCDAPRPALDDAVAALGPGLSVTPVVTAGLAAPAIVAYAVIHGVDLIVLGTHSRTGLSHILLGSVAEAVIRQAPCRVLTVPSVAKTPSLPALARCIVCEEPSSDLVCARCRTDIRAEALERTWNE
jgi:nucleotide-binding universal stress UspA family protein